MGIPEKIETEGAELKRAIREKTSGYILAAFGLVAALAWNEAIKSMIDALFPLEQNSLLAKFIYALLITVVVVVVSVYVSRLQGAPKN